MIMLIDLLYYCFGDLIFAVTISFSHHYEAEYKQINFSSIQQAVKKL